MKHAYQYALLKYVHDIATAESVNVGVVVFSPDAVFLRSKIKRNVTRITNFFPGFDADMFKHHARYLDAKFESLNGSLDLNMRKDGDLKKILSQVLSPEEGGLVWSEPLPGVTDDLEKTVDRLFDRLVSKFDKKSDANNRVDAQVWRTFKKQFESIDLVRKLESRKVSVSDDEYEFEFAFKNGVWHYFNPVSFDLNTSEGIKEKAIKLLGSLTSVESALKQNKDKVYALVGEPSCAARNNAFRKAISILRRAPQTEVILESQAPELARRLARCVPSNRV